MKIGLPCDLVSVFECSRVVSGATVRHGVIIVDQGGGDEEEEWRGGIEIVELKRDGGVEEG